MCMIQLFIIHTYVYAVPDPNVTISPPSPIIGAVVGGPLIAECIVNTVGGVELSDVMINWTGPGVLTDRFIMGSIISNGNNTYSRTFQLTHLIQTDENSTYFCIVLILKASVVESFEIASLTGENCILPIIKYEIYYIKQKSHLSVCLSVRLSVYTFGMLITQLCQHGLKRDLLEMKAVSLRITKFIFTESLFLQAYGTHRFSTGVPRRRRCK